MNKPVTFPSKFITHLLAAVTVFSAALIFMSTKVEAQVTVAGSSGADGSFTTLKSAFDAINASAQSGNVITIDISGDTTETATAALNTGAWASVTIRPTATATISGTIAGAVIRLDGADNVTIDGRVGGVGTKRDLSVINNSPATATAAIWLSSVAAGNGASNNVVRNLELACGVNQSAGTNTTFGIIISGVAISTTSNGVDNDNNSFIANRIIRCRYGIVTRGTTSNLNINPVVTDNIIGPMDFGADQIGKTGILMQADTGATVSRNTVQTVGTLATQTPGLADHCGICIGTESWGVTDSSTITSNTYTVTRNLINNIIEEKAGSAIGIKIGTTGGGNPTNNLVANNFIMNVRANGASGDQVVGIGIAGGHTDRVVSNSISITGDQDPGAATASATFGNAIRLSAPNSSTHLNLTLMNNSIYLDASSSSTAAERYYAITATASTYLFGTGGLNYNNYYINPANTQVQSGGLGTNTTSAITTQFATLTNWQTAFTVAQDANSIQADPLYFSNTSDLHIQNPSPNINNGLAIAGITNDFDDDPRPGSNPDIGADELVQSSGGSIAGGTYYNASVVDGDSLGGNVSITNQLWLGGKPDTGANTLTIGCNATITGAGPANYVIGNLVRTFCAVGTKSFEVGTANGYSPVEVNVTAGTFPADLTIKATQAAQPVLNPITSLQRYWTLTESGDLTADLTFNYLDPPDVAGIEANYHLIRVTGGTAVTFLNNCPTPPAGSACVDPTANVAFIGGVSNFSDWTAGEPATPTATAASISGRVTGPDGAPVSGVTMLLSGGRSARAITDGNGSYGFSNVEVNNLYTLTPSLHNHTFAPATLSFSLLGDMTNAAFTATRSAVGDSNVIDMPGFFVRQHYLDFLGREPDELGFAFWNDQILSCGIDLRCIERRTINVSAAYFLSIEFQKTAGLVDRLHRAAYGRNVLYAEFIPDTAAVGEDVVVGKTGWEEKLMANKHEFVNRWVKREAFHTAFDNLADNLYVDTLLANAGMSYPQNERDELVNSLTNGSTRAAVLLRIAEDQRFVEARYNEAFILMQYLGYLRRDPDPPGYQFWLDKLNLFGGNFERADLVKAFLVSEEYRSRFR